ncbi:hypothetical protein Rcae01_01682 [Novipirellula caenicola]|uniref:Uncharacterized protein n=1 Tax=Novipirellula caenicola TaxID=1536901 RepID=A0ABP9VNR4_9BACT
MQTDANNSMMTSRYALANIASVPVSYVSPLRRLSPLWDRISVAVNRRNFLLREQIRCIHLHQPRQAVVGYTFFVKTRELAGFRSPLCREGDAYGVREVRCVQ